jgi:hypothetical protein
LAYTVDGFWLPDDVQRKLLAAGVEFESGSYAAGRPCMPDDDGAITARWPHLDRSAWLDLLSALRGNRQRVPVGSEFWVRLRSALNETGRQLADPLNPLRLKALDALPGYTGYSEAMIRSTLGALEMMALEAFPAAYALSPSYRAARGWQSLGELGGRLRFYPSRLGERALARMPGWSNRPLYGPALPPDLVVGYGAGNVPGTALLIALLSLATTLSGSQAPVVLVRNSRQEPIFSSLVLEALHQADPDLVASLAILVWDYEDIEVQDILLGQADLVVAAASDETIAQLRAQVNRNGRRSQTRFHAHGHKVSFSAIGKEVLRKDLADRLSGGKVLDIVALLAGLDSVYWDQYGCLSARVHFVEKAGDGSHSPLEYARSLERQLRLLSEFLPRGAWPRQVLHDRFDRYKQLEVNEQVRVLSGYDDEFLLVYDERPLSAAAFFSQVNDCQGRVIVVRPVDDLMEIPQRYLRLLPSGNLQSLSVAVGSPEGGLGERFYRFAQACGACGVTGIRTVGRGAFPGLAYSWDGLLPLDLVRGRPPGRFTTIEFDSPYDQIMHTYRLLQQRGEGQGLTPP